MQCQIRLPNTYKNIYSEQHLVEALSAKLRIECGYTFTSAVVSQIRHEYDENTNEFLYEDTKWAQDFLGEADEAMLNAWKRSRDHKIQEIQDQYDEAPEYWSSLKYFLDPMRKPEMNKAFEEQELRHKYRSLGHKVLSDQGFSFFQKLSWIVAYKICPF